MRQSIGRRQATGHRLIGEGPPVFRAGQIVEAGDPPQVVADMVVKAATALKPKLRYSAGKQSRQVRALRRFVPERLVDRILRKFNEFPS